MDERAHDHLAVNLANWNSRVPHHVVGADRTRSATLRTCPASGTLYAVEDA